MKRVLCVGECMMELTPLGGNTLRLGFAGDTYNTAVYLRRAASELDMGVEVGYLTGLGDDEYSAAMRAAWSAESITDHALTVPGRVPGIYAVRTAPDGERTFTYWRDQSAARALFAGSGWCRRVEGDLVHLSGITLQLTSPRSRRALVARLRVLRSRGTLVSFDTNYRPVQWASPAAAAAAMTEICTAADVVLASHHDEQLLHGSSTPADGVRRIRTLGPAEAIVSDGPAGVHVGVADAVVHVPARHVEPVVDTTAAGDAFAGCYLAARLANRAPHDAAALANGVAATVIRHAGAIVPAGEALVERSAVESGRTASPAR